MNIDGAFHRPEPFELLLFTTDPRLVAEATRAGMDGFVIDWERRGKQRRQAGQNTQINNDTLADLERARTTTTARVLCRLNGFGPWTRREVDAATAAGADELMLPMVRNPREVDAVLRMVRDRCGVGILIETQDGVRQARELARRPLSRVYIGLNDLRIDRGRQDLFEPLVDGTVEEVRRWVDGPRFGVAGLTLPHLGSPVPTTLIAAELIRVRSDFTFLRRSFLADTAGQPLAPAVTAIRTHLDELSRRPAEERARDRAALVAAVGRRWAVPA